MLSVETHKARKPPPFPHQPNQKPGTKCHTQRNGYFSQGVNHRKRFKAFVTCIYSRLYDISQTPATADKGTKRMIIYSVSCVLSKVELPGIAVKWC